MSGAALHLCGDIRVLRISKAVLIAAPWFPRGVLYRIKLGNLSDGAYISKPSLKGTIFFFSS